MANEVKLTFAGDSRSLDRAMDSIGESAKDMGRDLDAASDRADKFDRSVEGVTGGLETTTGRLRGTNDLIGGFAGVVGLSLPPQADMIMGFADMADGLAVLLGPALKSAMTAMKALNLTFLTSPIGITIAAIVALSAAFVVAYKKSETFREIVDKSLAAVNKAAKFVAEAIGKYAEIWLAPWKAAINGIKWLWDNTIGKLSVPDWVEKAGGFIGGAVGKLPGFANGGRYDGGPMVVGERGPELLIPDGSGSIVPRNQLSAGSQQVVVKIDLTGGDRQFQEWMKKQTRVMGGGSVQAAWGTR